MKLDRLGTPTFWCQRWDRDPTTPPPANTHRPRGLLRALEAHCGRLHQLELGAVIGSLALDASN